MEFLGMFFIKQNWSVPADSLWAPQADGMGFAFVGPSMGAPG